MIFETMAMMTLATSEPEEVTIPGPEGVLAGTLIGWVLGRFTDAAFPFLDSVTTVAAIVATVMVARKVIENWIYWFVIDSLYIYLYIERELEGYAALYGLYLVIIVFGFRSWLLSYRAEHASEQGVGRV